MSEVSSVGQTEPIRRRRVSPLAVYFVAFAVAGGSVPYLASRSDAKRERDSALAQVREDTTCIEAVRRFVSPDTKDIIIQLNQLSANEKSSCEDRNVLPVTYGNSSASIVGNLSYKIPLSSLASLHEDARQQTTQAQSAGEINTEIGLATAPLGAIAGLMVGGLLYISSKSGLSI